jgi:hypothetical protein
MRSIALQGPAQRIGATGGGLAPAAPCGLAQRPAGLAIEVFDVRNVRSTQAWNVGTYRASKM